MVDMLIRDVPKPAHDELKRRAAADGLSLQAYMRKLLEGHLAKPSLTEWLGTVRSLPPVQTSMTGAEAVAAGREDA